MSRTVRPLALIATLLALALGLPGRQAHALTIAVDGQTTPTEWPAGPPPNGTEVISGDGGDVNQANRDISSVFYTNNATTLFFRVDTQNATLRSGGTVSIALDTGSGGLDNATGQLPAGTDFVVRITGTNPSTISFVTCSTTTCATTSTSSSSPLPNGVQAAAGSTFTEFGIPVDVVNVTSSTTSIGIAALFTSSGGNDNAPNSGLLTVSVPGPLPVTLASFTATRQGEGVKLAWATSSEIGVAGYHLLRGTTGQRADAARITSAPIPADGDGVTGGSYRFLDTGAAAGTEYHYWLQVLGVDGAVDEEYGPVAAGGALGAENRVHLPLVRR